MDYETRSNLLASGSYPYFFKVYLTLNETELYDNTESDWVKVRHKNQYEGCWIASQMLWVT